MVVKSSKSIVISTKSIFDKLDGESLGSHRVLLGSRVGVGMASLGVIEESLGVVGGRWGVVGQSWGVVGCPSFLLFDG